MRHAFTTTFVFVLSIFALWSSAFAQGRIIAIGDDWLLSDSAFTTSPPQTKQLVENIAGYFAGGVGNFLAASNSIADIFGARGVNGGELATHMQSLGHSWTVESSPTISLANLSQYDAVFFAGAVGSGSGNSSILSQYVQEGGSVLVMGGTGDLGLAAAEAAAWNPFLNQFGLGLSGDTWFAQAPATDLLVVPVVGGSNPLNQSLATISWDFGQLTLDLDPSDPLNAVAVEGNFSAFGDGPQGAINDIIAVYNVPVPEPSSLLLLLLGTVSSVLRLRRAVPLA